MSVPAWRAASDRCLSASPGPRLACLLSLVLAACAGEPPLSGYVDLAERRVQVGAGELLEIDESLLVSDAGALIEVAGELRLRSSSLNGVTLSVLEGGVAVITDSTLVGVPERALIGARGGRLELRGSRLLGGPVVVVSPAPGSVVACSTFSGRQRGVDPGPACLAVEGASLDVIASSFSGCEIAVDLGTGSAGSRLALCDIRDGVRGVRVAAGAADVVIEECNFVDNTGPAVAGAGGGLVLGSSFYQDNAGLSGLAGIDPAGQVEGVDVVGAPCKSPSLVDCQDPAPCSAAGGVGWAELEGEVPAGLDGFATVAASRVGGSWFLELRGASRSAREMALDAAALAPGDDALSVDLGADLGGATDRLVVFATLTLDAGGVDQEVLEAESGMVRFTEPFAGAVGAFSGGRLSLSFSGGVTLQLTFRAEVVAR